MQNYWLLSFLHNITDSYPTADSTLEIPTESYFKPENTIRKDSSKWKRWPPGTEIPATKQGARRAPLGQRKRRAALPPPRLAHHTPPGPHRGSTRCPAVPDAPCPAVACYHILIGILRTTGHHCASGSRPPVGLPAGPNPGPAGLTAAPWPVAGHLGRSLSYQAASPTHPAKGFPPRGPLPIPACSTAATCPVPTVPTRSRCKTKPQTNKRLTLMPSVILRSLRIALARLQGDS